MPESMLQIHHLDSLNHPDGLNTALDVYRHLKDRQLKCREGLFIAEGLEVVRRLLRSRFQVHSLLLTAAKLERLRADLQGLKAPICVATVKQMEAIAGFAIHRGAVACGFREPPVDLETAIATASRGRLIVVLENICDAQNIGVIIRNAAAFGADLVILSGCCDPFYRRAIRVSMGNVFAVPLFFSENLVGDLISIRQRLGVELIGTELSPTATPFQEAPASDRLALLLGAEGTGLSTPVLEICDRRVVIPITPNSDSVNVAVASGIFLYAYSSPSVSRVSSGSRVAACK